MIFSVQKNAPHLLSVVSAGMPVPLYGAGLVPQVPEVLPEGSFQLPLETAQVVLEVSLQYRPVSGEHKAMCLCCNAGLLRWAIPAALCSMREAEVFVKPAAQFSCSLLSSVSLHSLPQGLSPRAFSNRLTAY